MSTSRLEKFVYVICSMEVSDLPVPLSRIEKLWNCLITGETPDFEPQSRNEKYLMAMLGLYELDQLPTPLSRGEKLLYKIAVGETDLSDVPGYLSRYEELLKYLIENGGVGDFEYILQTLNQSLSTLYQTVEKPVKSAILRGQTLVNISTKKSSNTFTFQSAYNGATPNRVVKIVDPADSNTLTKPSTRYIVKFTVSNYINNYGGSVPITIVDYDIQSEVKITQVNGNGDYYIIGVTKETLGYNGTILIKSNAALFENNTETKVSLTISNIMVLDYQEGMENWDIPYFEGMQSVKMPVLTTTGKNLFSCSLMMGLWNKTQGKPVSNDSYFCTSDFIKVYPNTVVKVSGTAFNPNATGNVIFYGKDKNYLGDNMQTWVLNNAKIPSNAHYMGFHFKVSDLYDINGTIQIEVVDGESSPITTYEPYKSNILSTPEDLELRGIGNVKDELNVATGELTQRIGEIVLNGSEYWTYSGDHVSNEEYVVYHAKITVPINSSNIGITDKLPYDKDAISTTTFTKECVYINSTYQTCYVRIKRERSGINDYLTSNPLTVQYELATPVVKTVDLTTVDQNGQPTKLKTFNDITYVEIGADHIVPSVDMEIATKINETLSTMGLEHHDISETQNKLSQTIDEQTENTDATMMATTEIYENL